MNYRGKFFLQTVIVSEPVSKSLPDRLSVKLPIVYFAGKLKKYGNDPVRNFT